MTNNTETVMCECGAPVDAHGSEWDDCPGPAAPEPTEETP